MPKCHKCGKSEKVMKCVCKECSAEATAKPLTNADHIQNMSDEELAELIYSFEDLNSPDYCQRKKECDDMLDTDTDIPTENCRRCLVDWLKQKRASL